MAGGLTARIHDTAAAGLSAGSGAYARGRPSYPADAIEFLASELGLGPGTKVLDLAAGTGKFTALLVPTGAEVVAVEPVKEMGDELGRAISGVEVLEGTAEAIPLPDASVDAVTVAQAFHWFDADAALVEIARVLEPGGGLAFLWNRRDESVEWVREMSEVLHWHEFGHSDYDQVDWRAVVAKTGLFTEVQHRRFNYRHELDREGLADRVRSISYVAAMDEAQREQRVQDVLRLVDDKPDRFPLPYNTLVFWCSKPS
jgi:ubiquinone/menaquinone biosynthesis C-methylase UbiE